MPKINQNRSSRLATVMLRGTTCIFRQSEAKIKLSCYVGHPVYLDILKLKSTRNGSYSNKSLEMFIP